MNRRSASGSQTGRSKPAARASSIIVSGRSALSRWVCSSALGRRREHLTRQHRAPPRSPAARSRSRGGSTPRPAGRPGASSIPRASVTYALPAATWSASAGIVRAHTAADTVPGSTSSDARSRKCASGSTGLRRSVTAASDLDRLRQPPKVGGDGLDVQHPGALGRQDRGAP